MVRADAVTKESLLGVLNMVRADAVTKESLLGALRMVRVGCCNERKYTWSAAHGVSGLL